MHCNGELGRLHVCTPTYGIKKSPIENVLQIMTSHTIQEHYSCIKQYISKINYRNGEHKICYKLVLFTCSVDRQRVMGSGSKIVSANVSTEPSCELAASSSQNSLPGGRFMEVNADMSTKTEPTCELAAHWFVYVKNTFLVHP